MASGKQADENAIDHILLADDDLGDFRADTVEFSDRLSDISFTEHLYILRQVDDSGGGESGETNGKKAKGAKLRFRASD